MSKIYIVEDDQNIRELVVYALQSVGMESVGYEEGRAFWAAMEFELPSLILLDIMLPDEDGISLLKKLRGNKNTERLPIIMLTAKSSEYDRVVGLDLGADDYVVKPFSILELISRIKRLLRRVPDREQAEGVLHYEDILLNLNKHEVLVAGETVALTYKEFELLHLMIINQDIVLSREKIMNQIWGFDFEGESRTIDMHIKTLRKKLGGAGSYIKTIRGVGYKIGE